MTPSPVLWGQEKFRDTNNASDGFGKWFARIVTGSVRQLPYSLRVDGRTTYIVGYSYTSTGTQEPTVGNDWYPVNLDQFDNQNYASVDAYIASENGKATLQGCGVTALVPLATATQRLAENGINITVKVIGQMVEQRNESSFSSAYGKFLALVVVNGVRYCPFRYETFEQGGYTYMRSWMLSTSQSGSESKPSATTLYELVDSDAQDAESWEETYRQDVWPELHVEGPCTYEQALAWLNAGGASYTIVRL